MRLSEWIRNAPRSERRCSAFSPHPTHLLETVDEISFFFTNPAVAVFSPLFYFNFASPSVFFIFFVASSLLCCTALQFFEIPYGFNYFFLIIFKRVLRKNSSPSILLCSDKGLSCFLVPARARCLRVPTPYTYLSIYTLYMKTMHSTLAFFLRDYFSSNLSPGTFLLRHEGRFVNTPQQECFRSPVTFAGLYFLQIFSFVFL